MTGRPGNGRFEPGEDADDGEDDDRPLDAAEEVAAAAAALAETDETLDERVGQVVADLDGVEHRREGESVTLVARGTVFAVLMPEVLEVRLEAAVATAALRTPDVAVSARGGGWLAFTPAAIDRFALDRAEAWVRSAYRHATTTGRRD